MKLVELPYREYALIVLVLSAFGLGFLNPGLKILLWPVALAGALPTLWGALVSFGERRVNIDVFNIFALGVSFASSELNSAAFIVLMLSFARLLDFKTQSRTRSAVEELLKLKPLSASIEKNGGVVEVPVESLRKGDTVIAKNGSRVPVDGVVIFGRAWVNEAAVSGESALVEKIPGERVLGGTLNESGLLKIRAVNVGADSTLERMAALMKEASRHKSHPEKLADKFSQWFLPLVLLAGLATYFLTKNISMVAALFLVACADDMAVAIPLAMTAAMGRAAKSGVLVKGGEHFDALRKSKVLVIDKTGTLTYGKLAVAKVQIDRAINPEKFWWLLSAAEKFSEHPIARAVVRESLKFIPEAPDPDEFFPREGGGVRARLGEDEVSAGDESILRDTNIFLSEEIKSRLEAERRERAGTTFLVFINKNFAGLVTVSDIPRPEAKKSLRALKALGVERIIMFTGDSREVSRRVGGALGIEEIRAEMSPEDKFREIEKLAEAGSVIMVGDGINDAPALARSDVGIAMGEGGTAVAVEAADIVILTDNLSRLAEARRLSAKTLGVIYGDMVLWFLSNAVGFTLVFTGVAGPALAAFYNFATDFLPLLNSARLFGSKN